MPYNPYSLLLLGADGIDRLNCTKSGIPVPLNDCLLYVLLLNQKLQELSLQYGYSYLNFFDGYVSGEGTLKSESTQDGIHTDEYISSTKLWVRDEVAKCRRRAASYVQSVYY